MKSKTRKPKFDAEGYQTGEPNILGEPVDFDSVKVLTPIEQMVMGLPSLDELAGNANGQTKITLAFDDDALEFFKTEAKKRKTSYQRMIRNLVRAYALANKRSE